MKTKLKWILAGFVLAGLALLFAPSFIMGNGSKSYAREVAGRLSAFHTLSDVTSHFECLDVTGMDGRIRWNNSGNRLTLLTFSNGGWMVLHSLGSHGHLRGGTLVTHDSTGATRVFFGHVCAPETLKGQTMAEAYSNLLSIGRFNRKEIFLDDRRGEPAQSGR